MIRRRTPAESESNADHRDSVLLQLIDGLQRVNERLDALETRFEHLQRNTLNEVDAHDVLELRLHSARLAAELSRVTVELRAEIDELAQQWGRDALSELPPATLEEEPVIDLTERRARRSSGWLPLDE